MSLFSGSDVLVLNAPDLDDNTFLVERRGTTSAGTRRKPRYSIEIRSQPVLYDLDPLNLGQKPAEAIKGLIQDQMRHIGQVASKATQAARKTAAVAFAAGKGWAQKRYSGGRIGAMAPNQSDKLFNDSGRLREGIFVRQNPTDKTWTVNAPANRLDPATFGSQAQYLAMFERLRELVPALNPDWLATNKTLESAIQASLKDMIQVAETQQAAKLKQLAMERRRALLAAAKAVVEVAAG